MSKQTILMSQSIISCIGDKRRAERAQLNSGDGVTGETHDQFYRDHKLLLVLFRALAVMPITRSSPGQYNLYLYFFAQVLGIEFDVIIIGKVTFSWKSLATAYAVFFYAVMTGVVFIVGRERIRILQTTKKFDDKIYAILFVIFLVPHFWIPFVGWGKYNSNRNALNRKRTDKIEEEVFPLIPLSFGQLHTVHVPNVTNAFLKRPFLSFSVYFLEIAFLCSLFAVHFSILFSVIAYSHRRFAHSFSMCAVVIRDSFSMDIHYSRINKLFCDIVCNSIQVWRLKLPFIRQCGLLFR